MTDAVSSFDQDSDLFEARRRVGVKLKLARQTKGLTLKELASRSHCSESLLSKAENGKARVWAFEEILDQAVTARYYARLAPGALKPHRRLTALPGLVSATEHHVPKGVVGVISPWNYPLVLAVSDALAALVAGNGIVIKPDTQTPFTAKYSLFMRRLRSASASARRKMAGCPWKTCHLGSFPAFSSQ